MRARAHWPNDAQIDLTVVVVIVGVFVVAVVDELWTPQCGAFGYFKFCLGHTDKQTNKPIHGGVYRVAPQLKMRTN